MRSNQNKNRLNIIFNLSYHIMCCTIYHILRLTASMKTYLEQWNYIIHEILIYSAYLNALFEKVISMGLMQERCNSIAIHCSINVRWAFKSRLMFHTLLSSPTYRIGSYCLSSLKNISVYSKAPFSSLLISPILSEPHHWWSVNISEPLPITCPLTASYLIVTVWMRVNGFRLRLPPRFRHKPCLG